MDLLRKRPDLALHIMEIVGNRLRLLEERLVEATYSPVKVRLAHFLLSNSDQTSGLLTNFTHEEIGDNIGALRQTVTEILGLMQKQRLILIRPRQIRIINRAEIENIIDNHGKNNKIYFFRLTRPLEVDSSDAVGGRLSVSKPRLRGRAIPQPALGRPPACYAHVQKLFCDSPTGDRVFSARR